MPDPTAEAFAAMERARESMEAAEAAYKESLLNLERAAGNKTFQFKGTIYQIRRTRKNGEVHPFIVKLDTTPRKWLAEAKKRKQEAIQDESGLEEIVPDDAGGDGIILGD